ncbi:MAG: hypothetical protein GXP02_07385 [Alphaproteobacteria bacterium]|nr:hypothetical protein [Alphaproteobacteria bacterium]
MIKPVSGLLAATIFYSMAFVPMASAQTLQDLKAQINQLSKKVSELEKKQAAKAENPQNLKIKWKGAPEFSSADGKFKMKIRGRLFFDYGSVSVKDGAGTTIPADKINGVEIRTARIGVEGVLFSNIKYKFEADFEGNKTTAKDAYIEYHFKPVSIRVGQFKHMTSLEEQTSSRYITFMERASFTDAFKFSRRMGVAVSSHGKNWTASAGYFFEGFGTANKSANDRNLFAARVTYSPLLSSAMKVHLGASFFSRDNNGKDYLHGYSQRPHNHQSGKFVTSQKFDITRETFYGVELASIMGPFSAQAEWGWMKNSLAAGEMLTSTDPTYNGGYISFSYFVTGETRSYSGKKGAFGRTKVLSPVNEGGVGAWQIAARYDVIDLVHENFGEKQDTYLFGVNWLLNSHTRIMANYSRSTINNSSGIRDNKIDAFGARFQVDW